MSFLSLSTQKVSGLTCTQEVPFLSLDRGQGPKDFNDTLLSKHVTYILIRWEDDHE